MYKRQVWYWPALRVQTGKRQPLLWQNISYRAQGTAPVSYTHLTFVGLGRRAEIWNTNVLNTENGQIDMQSLKQSLREAGFRYGRKPGV